MLIAYRRHQKNCEHQHEGRDYRRCRCVVWADGSVGGVEIRKSLRTRDWEKAQDIVRQWEAGGQPTTQSKQSNAPITVGQAWQDFLSDMEARNLSVSTVRKYKLLSRTIQDFAARRGLRFLVQVDLVTLRAFREGWRDRPLSSAKKLERLRAFFRFAQESKWIEDNPASKLKTPKVTQRPTLPFTHEEMLRVLAALDPFYDQVAPSGRNSARRLRALVLLLRYSGMRIGDAVKLTTDRITGSKLFLYTQKTGVPVYTVLPDFVVRALDAIPRVTPTHFFWNGASSLDAVVGSWQRRLRELFRLAKVMGGHAHRFRDTFAAELLLAAVPIERVAVLLGHQSVKVTEKYYAAWTASRQRQVEADLQLAWDRDPIVLLETKGTPQVHGKPEAVN
jgi:integrase/recombinase XerD